MEGRGLVPNAKLPARPSLEYLRKVAKDRLTAMRRTDPRAQLASALLDIAQEHGFTSWRALKAEVDRRQLTDVERFIAACRAGDVAAVRALLDDDPALLHARDPGHHATGIYFAAGAGHVETVRTLIDRGADVRDQDDVTGLGVIGWVTCSPPSKTISMEVLSLLVARGARHHIFSAIAVGDLDLLRAVVEENPAALDRRMAREHGQTPLHFAITRGRADLLDLLIALGADVDGRDANQQTPLDYAMLRGDHAAIERLHAAGATHTLPAVPSDADTAALAASVQGGTLIMRAPDVADTLRWYTSIGFTEHGRYPTDGTTVYWGLVSLGRAEVMFELGTADAPDATLLIDTTRIQDLYSFLQSRQLEAGRVRFVEMLHEPPWGGLQFSVRDCNGYTLRFLQGAMR